VDNLYINEKEKNGQAGVDDDGNGFVDDVYGYNFVEAKDVVGGTIQPDNEGHGTHVAGTVAARNNNGKGVAGVAGGNGTPDSGVRLMSCQIFRGKDEQGDAAAAIKYAADNGAVICQNSWGYSSTSGVTAMPKLLKEAVDYFIKMAGCDENGQQRANSPMKGGVVVFAAGNENKEFAAYPACYPPAVSVSAMAWNFAKASFSNYARWITIMAPGGDQDTFGTEGGILSTVPKSKAPSGYAYFQGTSMACPHVSGIAALIASYFGRQGFTNEELKSRLITAYRPFNIDELNPAYKGKLGKWYIDAEAAFESDTKIAPEKVGTLTLTPDFVDITAEWSIAKDEDKTAAFYRLYISPNDLTAENLKDMSFKEINGMGHSLGEKLRFTFDNLKDNKAYSIAVVAVDRWGNLSEPAIQKCTTKLNHAPEVTNFPEEVIELNNNERKTFSFNVADPDGHNWDIRAIGETKGVSYSINQATVTVSIVPVLQAGSYTCTFVLTDDLDDGGDGDGQQGSRYSPDGSPEQQGQEDNDGTEPQAVSHDLGRDDVADGDLDGRQGDQYDQGLEQAGGELQDGHQDGGDRGDNGAYGWNEVQEKGQDAPAGRQFHVECDEHHPGREGRGQADEAQSSKVAADLPGDRVEDVLDPGGACAREGFVDLLVDIGGLQKHEHQKHQGQDELARKCQDQLRDVAHIASKKVEPVEVGYGRRGNVQGVQDVVEHHVELGIVQIVCSIELHGLQGAEVDPEDADAEKYGEDQGDVQDGGQVDPPAQPDDGAKDLEDEPCDHQGDEHSAGQIQNRAKSDGGQQGHEPHQNLHVHSASPSSSIFRGCSLPLRIFIFGYRPSRSVVTLAQIPPPDDTITEVFQKLAPNFHLIC